MAWLRDPARHALAAKGIATGRFQSAQLREVEHGNAVRGSFGRRGNYDHLTKKLGGKYREGDAVDSDDYEKAITPIFDTLAEADILCDKGDVEGAAARLELASSQYSSLCERFNVIRDADAREFLSATKLISEKTIQRSRAPPLGTVVARSPPQAISQQNVNEKSGSEDHVFR